MASLAHVKQLYVLLNDNGIAGIYTTKQAASDNSDAERGDICHVVSAADLNTPLYVNAYEPPSVPTLSYGTSEVLLEAAYEPMPEVSEERYAELAAAQTDEDREFHEAVRGRRRTPEVPKTPKDIILAKLAADLGVEEPEDDVLGPEEPLPAPTARAVAPPKPTGGTSTVSPLGDAGVEFFSPV
jgi:hypothetical protein